jgi:hypothetical protein
MITKTGVFIAENNESPAYVIAEDAKFNRGNFKKNQRAPALSAWSDVTYLQWVQTAGNNVKQRQGIKYFFRFHVINEPTMQIIDRVSTSTDFPPLHTLIA